MPEPAEQFNDELIEEIRAIRKELSDRFDNDPVRLCEYLRTIQGQGGRQVVDGPARQPQQNHEGRRAI